MNVSCVRVVPGEVTIHIEGDVTLTGSMEQLNKDYETVYSAIRKIEEVCSNDVDRQSCA